MRRVQPERRRVAGVDGPARRVSDRTTASAGAGACSAVHRPSRRAEAEALEPTLAHTRCPQPLHRTAGARREGGRPARVVVADSAAPPARARPQLPRHRSPLTTVRAAAPSMQPCTPPFLGLVPHGPPPCGLSSRRFPGWAGGLSALRGTALRARLRRRNTVSRESRVSKVERLCRREGVCRRSTPLIRGHTFYVASRRLRISPPSIPACSVAYLAVNRETALFCLF